MTSSSPDWTILGGMSLPETIRGFSRAPLVVQRGTDDLVITRLVDDGVMRGETDPAGELLAPDEWPMLMRAEEGFALRTPRPAFAHAGLWILGTSFDFKQHALTELEQRRAYRVHEEHGDAWVVLVDESRAAGLRDAWAAHAFQNAWNQACQEDIAACVRSAEVALELPAPRMNVRYLAMCRVAYALAGDKFQAEDLSSLVRNSRGAELHDQMLELEARFMRELDQARSMGSPPGTPNDPARSRRQDLRRAAIKKSFASFQWFRANTA